MDEPADYAGWVSKAEGDREGATMMMSQFRDSIGYLIAFHCQQGAEKYLKALLVWGRIPFPRTHDLSELALLAQSKHAEIDPIRPALGTLQPYAVNVRYPGFDPDHAACEEALRCLEHVRAFCRQALQLDPSPPAEMKSASPNAKVSE